MLLQIKVTTVNVTLNVIGELQMEIKRYIISFAQNDQVVCQTFNVGTTDNVLITYYWRLCTEVGTETIENVLYNYVILSRYR